MSMRHQVDDQGRYDGRTLQELWPAVVDEIVDAVQPLEVILFGSVARGEDGPDSDIDVLQQWAVEARYPAELPESSRGDAAAALAIATTVVDIVRAAQPPEAAG